MLDISKIAGYQDGEFRLELIKKQTDSPVLIFSSGFMSKNDEEWSDFLSVQFPSFQLLRVRWDSGCLRDLATHFFDNFGERVVDSAISSVWTTVAPVLGWGRTLKAVRNTLTNSRLLDLWVSARNNSEAAGVSLADALNTAAYQTSASGVPCFLVGHSLGSRLMAHCLHDVQDRIVERAIFLGGAIDIEAHEVRIAETKTPLPSLNLYSTRDEILQWVYRLGNLNPNGAIGRSAINGNIKNIDTTPYISGHTKYCGSTEVADQMKKAFSDSLEYFGNRSPVATRTSSLEEQTSTSKDIPWC